MNVKELVKSIKSEFILWKFILSTRRSFEEPKMKKIGPQDSVIGKKSIEIQLVAKIGGLLGIQAKMEEVCYQTKEHQNL